MSDLEACILEAQAHFDLLRSVHCFVNLSLPIPEDVESERQTTESQIETDMLVNDITILRSDIKCLPIRLEQIDIDQITNDADVDRLLRAFDSLLGLFEDSVLGLEETAVGAATLKDSNLTVVGRFPKLVTLRSLRQQYDKAIKKDACGVDDPETAADGRSLFRRSEITAYIEFPPQGTTIALCRDTIESFGKVVADVFPDTVGRWNVESRLEEVTDAEIESIKDADAFSKTSSWLFRLLVSCITCKAEHIARLHLSGFPTPRLEMLLGTDKHDWIPAIFTPSTTAASPEQKFEHRMCAHTTAAEYCNQTIRGCFSETMVWEDCVPEPALYDLATATASANTLDHFLKGPSALAQCQYMGRTRRLDRVGRAIVGVFLACSLFRLCGSPWLQHGFEGESVFVLPNETAVRHIYYWRPHISCCLGPHPRPRSLPEDVAALGVLILELEANLLAGWTSDDEDYFTETKSNKARLYRILKEWKGDLTDFYRSIGSACFQFENLVETFEHPRVDPSLTSLAVLYKCIVNPLYQKLVSDYGEAQRLFQGTPGFCIPIRQKRASGSGCLMLYDDGESTEPDKKSEYATELMTTLKNGFVSSIRALRQNSQLIGLAESLKGMQTPEKIRVAVLDTGIDETDMMITAAKSRIKEKRSWVGSPGSYTDTYGHGTHVTRLLLQMAPAADIYIAKITDHKNVNAEDMSRIAEAIDWAVKEWDVHIISMSFGFGHHNKTIDDAIERAFKADKLMLAAASNEGGNKGRSRPGRNPRVICIHACDGKGNKGDMSPSPMKNKSNFTTLGVAVQSRWRKQTVYKSGTSFATPVAAAIAADLLEFANFKCKLAEEDKKLLYKHDGMEAVFQAMSTERDGYDYVQPGHLWDGKDDNEVAKVIQGVLAEL
ncbi:hypothetical protein DER44DRAFT_846806 [Fusarium oxysporum]|nr:hypothetical protein DER44DRAFT_846806 [Fusarium oxysporum]